MKRSAQTTASEQLSATPKEPLMAARNSTAPSDTRTSPALAGTAGFLHPLKEPTLGPFIEALNNFRNDNPPGVTA